MLPVVEIFKSFQGEGINIGSPAVFVRLFGCNAKCPWCDQKETEHVDLPVEDIIQQVKKHKTPLVVITGGEPTIHGKEYVGLSTGLLAAGFDVWTETNGTSSITAQHCGKVTCSPKRDTNWQIKCIPNELKFVIDAPDALKEAAKAAREWTGIPVWLQPCDGMIVHSLQLIRDYLLSEDVLPNTRAGIQLHKVYNTNTSGGVR